MNQWGSMYNGHSALCKIISSVRFLHIVVLTSPSSRKFHSIHEWNSSCQFQLLYLCTLHPYSKQRNAQGDFQPRTCSVLNKCVCCSILGKPHNETKVPLNLFGYNRVYVFRKKKLRVYENVEIMNRTLSFDSIATTS